MSEREILFRGKDLQEQNGWLYGYFYKSDINKRERESGKATLIFTPDCDTFIYVPEYHNSWMVKPETVGRYTGLTDKNGTRIFEGDILIYEYDGEYDPDEKYLVAWDNDEAAFRVNYYLKGEYIHYESITSHQYFEIVGNIHDNPELLEGE